MKEVLLKALIAHAQGHIEKHKANIQIYLDYSVGIGDHSDILDAMEKELDQMAKYEDHIELIKKYFS